MPKRIKRTLSSLCTALIAGLSLVGVGTNGLAADELSTNDLKELDSGEYKVTGIDPYFIIKLGNRLNDSRSITLDLGEKLSELKLEVFFKSNASVFDPYYKATYVIDSFPAKLKLPLEAASNTELRLDLVDCHNCQLNLSNVISADQPQADKIPLEPSEVLNGLSELGDEGRTIALDDWRLNDLTGELSGFEISGGDPYIVSPKLNTSTKGLAGVYFKFHAPHSGEAWDDFQLFYQTERHDFNIMANSNMRISQRANEQTLKFTEFLIPLRFLSQDSPPSSLLERIRLDLPVIAGEWSLIESKLIHENEQQQYETLKPKQLIHTKLQRASGLGLIKKSVLNVWADRSFVIAYLIMLSVIIFMFTRAFRRYS